MCATLGNAIARTELDGILSEGTTATERVPHTSQAEVGCDFFTLLAVGITAEQLESAVDGCDIFGPRRPRAWASAVLGTSKAEVGAVCGIATAEKPGDHEAVEGPSAAKKSKTDPTRIRCRHILLKHLESRSTVDKARSKHVSRTKFEAEDQIRGLLAEILADNARFSPLARQFSECSSAMKGGDQAGDLGWFSRGKMQKPFEDEAFNLEIGQISDLVQTESGVHVIQRVA